MRLNKKIKYKYYKSSVKPSSIECTIYRLDPSRNKMSRYNLNRNPNWIKTSWDITRKAHRTFFVLISEKEATKVQKELDEKFLIDGISYATY